MAIKKRSRSVLKNIRKSERRYVANVGKKRRLKAAIKALTKTEAKTEATKMYPKVQALIDKAVQDGILKKNTAARYKARLARLHKAPAKA